MATPMGLLLNANLKSVSRFCKAAVDEGSKLLQTNRRDLPALTIRKLHLKARNKLGEKPVGPALISYCELPSSYFAWLTRQPHVLRGLFGSTAKKERTECLGL